jgi:hypothetical protein
MERYKKLPVRVSKGWIVCAASSNAWKVPRKRVKDSKPSSQELKEEQYGNIKVIDSSSCSDCIVVLKTALRQIGDACSLKMMQSRKMHA